MTDDEVRVMLLKLSEHFREPVMPVSEYCGKLWEYQKALRDRADRTKSNDDVNHSNSVDFVFRMITKSNLLNRLIYCREELRTEMCPTHKGRWSGCVFEDNDCPHCMSGSNVTGWIAPKVLK